MRKFFLFYLVAVLFMTLSCNHHGSDNSKLEDTAKNDDYFYRLEKQDSLRKIDSLLETVECNRYSMAFAKPDNEQYLASMFCDSTGVVRRMEELSTDKNSLYSRNKFYFNKGGIFASTSEYQIMIDSNLTFVEEMNFYDSKGNIEKEYKKVTKNGDTEETDYTLSKDNKKLNTDRIFRAINNEGEFALTFQGIIHSDKGELDYLLVGSPEKDGFTTALQIEKRDRFMNDIYAHEKEYVGRKMRISFRRNTEGNFSYQSFVAAEWIE